MKKCLIPGLENIKLTKVIELIQIIASKFNELKQDLMTEIKFLIQLEVEKVVKKQKEEFEVTVLKLQERLTLLELEKDDLERSMDDGYASELTMYLLNPRKQEIVFMKRLVNYSGKHVQIYLCLALTEPTALGLNTSHTEKREMLQHHSLFHVL